MNRDELRKQLMVAETSIRTNVGDVCNLMLNGKAAEEQQLIEDTLEILTNCEKAVILCRTALET